MFLIFQLFPNWLGTVGFQISLNYLIKLNAKCIPNSSRPPLSFWEGVILCDLPCARTYECFPCVCYSPACARRVALLFSGRYSLCATCLAPGLHACFPCVCHSQACASRVAPFFPGGIRKVRPALRKAGRAFSLGDQIMYPFEVAGLRFGSKSP